MKDIDIIKGVQNIGDDLISKAADLVPVPRRTFRRGYAAAAAGAAVVAAVVSVIAWKLPITGTVSYAGEQTSSEQSGSIGSSIPYDPPRSGLIYAEIKFKYDCKAAAKALGLENAEVTTENGQLIYDELDRYIAEFAAGYGITIGEHSGLSTFQYGDGSLSSVTIGKALGGMFDTGTLEKMANDDRVLMITSDSSIGSEDLYLPPVTVTRGQMDEIPEGLSWGGLVSILGDTAQYGCETLHVYLTDSNGVIIIDYDHHDPNEICPFSGAELYDSAVPLELDGSLPETVSGDMDYAVILKYYSHSSLCMTMYNGMIAVGYCVPNLSVNPDGVEELHADGTSADHDEIFQAGNRVFIKIYEREAYGLFNCPGVFCYDKAVVTDK